MTNHFLDQFDRIAWDFDETLVNGPKSQFWQNYVRNHPEKTHYIVTFRGSVDVLKVEGELKEVGLDIDLFEQVIHLPDEISAAYNALHPELFGLFALENIHPKQTRIIERENLDFEDVRRINLDFRAWKPRVCEELGCKVLVDDLELWIKPHCDIHNVTFVNSLR